MIWIEYADPSGVQAHCRTCIVLEIKIERIRCIAGLAEMNKIAILRNLRISAQPADGVARIIFSRRRNIPFKTDHEKSLVLKKTLSIIAAFIVNVKSQTVGAIIHELHSSKNETIGKFYGIRSVLLERTVLSS